MTNLKKPACPKCGLPVHRGGNSRGAQRYHCRDRKTCKWHGCDPVHADRDLARGIDRVAASALALGLESNKAPARYVITAAQNATPIDKRFLASLLTYCRLNRAQLVVIPYRYKNPTSIWSAKAETDDWWSPEIAPYLIDRRVDLTPHLVLLADIKTQPTATSPLQGFETLTGGKSAIVGHPKLELITVPTPQARLPKILTTTGAITKKNYIPSKAGKKGEHHHTFGACVVEVSGRKFHLRQINAVRGGSFIDLEFEYDAAGRRRVPAAALVMGDTHAEFVDPAVVKATFDRKAGIIAALKPAQLVWHDLHDFYARNHHHRGEVFVNFVKHHTRRDNVARALDETFAFVDRVTPGGVRNIFVPSNHPDALARWVKEADPKTDPENAVFWAKTFVAMCEASAWTETGARTIDPFAYWGMKKLKSAARAHFLKRGESCVIKGIEVGFHSDVGPNGARGNRKGFSKIGVKTIIGHNHSPGITGGAYQVGLSARYNLEYTRGSPSSWLQTHCVIYANGKRSLINIIDGEWRL